MSNHTIDELHAAIFGSANSDGGWGYYAKHGSRIEPTCWALLAVLESGVATSRSAIADGRRFLEHVQQSNGLLADANQPSPNLAVNGLAAITRAAHPELADARVAASLIAGIITGKGVQLESSKFSRQNNQLQAWPWIDGTFSWVEPTAFCLLALKKWPEKSAATQSRIQEAERLIIDRSCRPGGWNYGNADIMGQDLRPYVPTTALALLAMQDRRDEPVVRRGLDFLRANRLKEVSGMALSLASIGLSVLSEPKGDVDAALAGHWARTGFLGNVQVMAMALYALTADLHGNRAFRL